MAQLSKSNGAYYGYDEPELESQTAHLNLSGHPPWKLIIDLTTPESSPCPSPVSETSDSNDSTDGEVDSMEETAPPPLPTPVQQMINILPFSGEASLLNYLHSYALTIADVEALVPKLLDNRIIMDKLAENIGYYSAHGSTTSTEIEQMLIYLVGNGDLLDRGTVDYRVYELTVSQINHFTEQASLQFPRRQGTQHNEYPVRTGNMTEPKKEIYHRACAGPSMDKQHKKHGQPTQVGQGKKKKQETAPDSSYDYNLPGFPDGQDATRTRKHNGPGLYDKKRPITRLPVNDTRQVWAKPGIVVDEKIESEQQLDWTRTKPTSRFLFKAKKAKMVVKLPPPPSSSSLFRSYLERNGPA